MTLVWLVTVQYALESGLCLCIIVSLHEGIAKHNERLGKPISLISSVIRELVDSSLDLIEIALVISVLDKHIVGFRSLRGCRIFAQMLKYGHSLASLTCSKIGLGFYVIGLSYLICGRTFVGLYSFRPSQGVFVFMSVECRTHHPKFGCKLIVIKFCI